MQPGWSWEYLEVLVPPRRCCSSSSSAPPPWRTPATVLQLEPGTNCPRRRWKSSLSNAVPSPHSAALSRSAAEEPEAREVPPMMDNELVLEERGARGAHAEGAVHCASTEHATPTAMAAKPASVDDCKTPSARRHPKANSPESTLPHKQQSSRRRIRQKSSVVVKKLPNLGLKLALGHTYTVAELRCRAKDSKRKLAALEELLKDKSCEFFRLVDTTEAQSAAAGPSSMGRNPAPCQGKVKSQVMQRPAIAATAQQGPASGSTKRPASAPWAVSAAKRPLRVPPRGSTNGKSSTRGKICVICCEDIDTSRIVVLDCGHGCFCHGCLHRYAEVSLESGAVAPKCPECAAPISDQRARLLLPPELMERFLERSLERAVSATPNLRPCPTPDCAMRVALEEGALPRLNCTLCGKESCLLCGAQPYHHGRTCQGAMAVDDSTAGLLQWMRETGSKQCPTCRMGVSKQHLESQVTQRRECHKMICRNCGTRFCFKCLTVLTATSRCKCSSELHGFIDPHTGSLVPHRKSGRPRLKAKPRPRRR